MSRFLAFAVLGVASTAAAEEPSLSQLFQDVAVEPLRVQRDQDKDAAKEPAKGYLIQVTPSRPAQIQHTVQGDYSAELSGFSDGTSTAASASLGGDLRYHVGLIDHKGNATYDIETGAGLTVGRLQGTLSTTQIATRGHFRIGPAAVEAGDKNVNIAWLPFTFELDHLGDLGKLPRLSSRPDANRGVLDRGQVSLATRVFRAESNETAPPDDYYAPSQPYSLALDVLTLFGDLGATVQDGTRLEAGIGGAMLSGTARYTFGHRIDFFGPEFRITKLPNGKTTTIGTLWMLRVELPNPATGSVYMMGLGVALGDRYDELSAPTEANPNPDLAVGGFGFWLERNWGGFGFQTLREPYITMAGEPALDDRGWIEAWRTGRHTLSARGFVARTQRASEDAWRSDWSTGLELGAHRRVKGVTVDFTLEAGRTHYAAFDGQRPDIGFAARGQLALRRSGSRSWNR